MLLTAPLGIETSRDAVDFENSFLLLTAPLGIETTSIWVWAARFSLLTAPLGIETGQMSRNVN